MCVELLEYGLFLETEKVDVIVHTSQRISLLVTIRGSDQPAGSDEETLFGPNLCRIVLLDEAIHGSCHAVKWLGLG